MALVALRMVTPQGNTGKGDTPMLYYLHCIGGMGKGGTAVLYYLHGIGSMDNGDTIG